MAHCFKESKTVERPVTTIVKEEVGSCNTFVELLLRHRDALKRSGHAAIKVIDHSDPEEEVEF
jgi:hypothetical protein